MELIEHRLVETFADPVGLRAPGLGLGVLDVLHGQVQLVLVVLPVPAVLRAPVCEDPQEPDAVLLEPGQDPVVEQVRGHQGVASVVELGVGDLGVGVQERLLVDASHALEGADVEGVLRAEIAWVFGLDLAVFLFLLLGLLQGDQLAFGEDPAVLSDACLQGLEPFLEGLQVMSQPDAADASRGDEQSLLSELVGDADLPVGGLFEGDPDDGLLDVGVDPILGDGLFSADLVECLLSAVFVELLEPVEAVA